MKEELIVLFLNLTSIGGIGWFLAKSLFDIEAKIQQKIQILENDIEKQLNMIKDRQVETRCHIYEHCKVLRSMDKWLHREFHDKYTTLTDYKSIECDILKLSE